MLVGNLPRHEGMRPEHKTRRGLAEGEAGMFQGAGVGTKRTGTAACRRDLLGVPSGSWAARGITCSSADSQLRPSQLT